MKLSFSKSQTVPTIINIQIGQLKLTTYHGSPWLGFELMRRMLFITLLGRRFEFRWLLPELASHPHQESVGQPSGPSSHADSLTGTGPGQS